VSSKVAALKVGPVKGMKAKGKQTSQVAHAEPTPVRKFDIHAIP